MYWRSVSSSIGVNRHRPLHLSVKGVISFIRSRNELSRRSYIFATRRIDIFLIIQITSITRVILVSLDRADISYIYRNDVWRKEVVMQVESARGDWLREVIVNHVNRKYIQIITILYFEFKKDKKSLTNIITR